MGCLYHLCVNVELLGFALSLSKQLKKDVHMIKKEQDMRVSSFEDHMDLIIVSPSSFFSKRTCRYLPFFFLLLSFSIGTVCNI